MTFKSHLGISVVKPTHHQPFFLNSASGICGNYRLSHSRTFKSEYRSREFLDTFSGKKYLDMAGQAAGKPRAQMIDFEFIKDNINGRDTWQSYPDANKSF